jgi:Raf kinase inhibitor-like YbhB/YbcL family protein
MAAGMFQENTAWRHFVVAACVAVAGGIAGCRGEAARQAVGRPPVAVLRVTSRAFKQGGTIPKRYTVAGAGKSPPLAWSRPPRGTRGFVLVVTDSDARGRHGPFVHWLLYGIGAKVRHLPAGIGRGRRPGMPPGAMQGRNTFGHIGYGPPAPPPGAPAHHYHFTLYALRKTPHLRPGMSRHRLMRAIRGLVIARGELVGTFGR